jgi:hypothetical protein
MIASTERQMNSGRLEAMNEEDEQEDEPIKGLINKYKGTNRSN